MFRTASMAWETYNLKNAHGRAQRSKQEESLEQRLYWTCLKSEWFVINFFERYRFLL